MKKIMMITALVLCGATLSLAQTTSAVRGGNEVTVKPTLTPEFSKAEAAKAPESKEVLEARAYLAKNTAAGAPADGAAAIEQANKVKAMKAKQQTNSKK
jgi:hypothetical protein